MSSKEALGILKNWRTARTCVSLKSIVATPNIRWSATRVTIESVDASTVIVAAVNTGERRSIPLHNAKFDKIPGDLGIVVALADGSEFSLEVETPA